MRKIKLILFLAPTCFYGQSLFGQIPWPFPISNQQASVTGSIGEYRSTNRFHQGVDLINGTNLAVHSIYAGTAQWNGISDALNCAITITSSQRTIVYRHVYPKNEIIANNGSYPISANEFMGNMIVDVPNNWPTHVHLEAANTNFLAHNLYPYEDEGPPYFSSNYISNGVAFYRNGLLKTTPDPNSLILNQQVTNFGISYTILYNKIDIVAHAIDPRVNPNGSDGGHQNVPSEISWYATDYFSNMTTAYQRLRFDGVPSNAAATASFHPLSVGPGNPSIHIITSNPNAAAIAPATEPIYDRFWNTGLAIGQNETFDLSVSRPSNLDAISNFETEHPDGPYKVRIDARDVDYDNDPNLGATQKIVNVLIDNFRPIIKEVIVKKNDANGSLVYKGTYNWDPINRQLVLSAFNKDDMDPLSNVWVKITTSEPCQNIQVNISPTDGSAYHDAAVYNMNYTEFIFTRLPITQAGVQRINIQGQDWAGNPLQTNPLLIPIRQSNGTWSAGVSGGTDSNHSFNAGTYVCTSGGSPNGRTINGRTEATTCLYADFTLDKTSCSILDPIIATPIVSGKGIYTYSWNFGSGALPATSTTSGPQTIVYSSAGQKSITLQVCDQSGTCQNVQKNVLIIGPATVSNLTADFTASQLAANTGQSIQLTSTITGATGNVSYLWSFDNGVSSGNYTDANPVISYSAASPGSKTISLTVTDDLGQVQKTKTSYLAITSPYFNVVPTIMGGCITTGADGVVQFSSSVSGGFGNAYTSYLWDFGDGTTSNSSAGLLSHTYKKSGKYTVRLTVCDGTGCGMDEEVNCVTVPNIIDAKSIDADFLVDNIAFGDAYTSVQVGLNTPVIFTDATKGGGDPSLISYLWNFDSHYFDIGTSQSSVPTTSSIRGPVEVYYTTEGTKEVSLWANADRDTKPYAVKVIKGLGSGTCYATLGTASVTTSCWSPTNLPKFSVPVIKSNCPVVKTDVTYWTNGVGTTGYLLPNGVLDFNALGIAVPTFPFTADFTFEVSQYDGINYNRIGYKRQRFTIYGPVTSDAGPDKQVCLGNSVNIGPGSIQNSNSYVWSSSAPSALSFLSSTNSPNPTFIGTQKGSYTYSLMVTNQLSGCKSVADNVTVSVDRPEITSIYFPITTGSTALAVGSSGGFGSNTFQWSPALNLSSATTSNPTFTSSQDGLYNYDVTVTDVNNCNSTGQIIVDVSSGPASLVAKAEAYNRISLTWLDRSSSETGFLIRKSVDGVTYVDYAAVGANTMNFDDINVVPGTTYSYIVAAQQGAGLSKFSNVSSSNTTTLPAFAVKSIPSSPYYGNMIDFDNDNDVDFASNGRLYKNDNGVYSSIPLPPYVGDPYIVADFDNDNDFDIFRPADGVLLRNEGSSFTTIQTGISNNTNEGWNLSFDYNRDNSVDVLSAKSNFTILQNSGNNAFTQIDTGIPVTLWKSSDFANYYAPDGTRAFSTADLDNDGLEELITGEANLTNPISHTTALYRNTGQYSPANKTIIDSQCCASGSIIVADVDNDDRIDFFGDGDGTGAYLYKNFDGATFFKTNNVFTHVTSNVKSEFGDFDLDGDLDLFVSTYSSVRVYQNSGGNFSSYYYYSEPSSPGMSFYAKWVDADGDGDLDIVTGGNANVIINNLGTNRYTANTRPQAPTQTCSYFDGNYIILSWNSGSDVETLANGLTYNTYLKADGKMLLSPMADLSTGFRKVLRMGNVNQNKFWKFYVGIANQIEWGVQSIDNSFIGSAFSNSVISAVQNVCGTLSSTTYRGTDIYSCSNTLIQAGTNVGFEATRNIKLQNGFRVSAGGTYSGKIVPISNPCPQTYNGGRVSTVTEVAEEEFEPQFSIYPNPSDGIYTVESEFKKTIDAIDITILNIEGQTVESRKYSTLELLNDQFDLSHHASGVYIFRISWDGKVKYFRVVKL